MYRGKIWEDDSICIVTYKCLEMSGKVFQLERNKIPNLYFCTSNCHTRINRLWRLGMYFDISFELINLGHHTNQHKGTAWETRAIIQMSGSRLTPGMLLGSSWPKSPKGQIPCKSHQNKDSFPQPLLMSSISMHTLLAPPRPSCLHQMESFFPPFAFGKTDCPNNSEAFTAGHCQAHYYWICYSLSPYSLEQPSSWE